MRKATWQAIADDISARIASGHLRPGERIAPETQLAKQLGVSRHTAHRAIHELQRIGLVSRQRRWGTVVSHPVRTKKHRIGYIADFTTNQF